MSYISSAVDEAPATTDDTTYTIEKVLGDFLVTDEFVLYDDAYYLAYESEATTLVAAYEEAILYDKRSYLKIYWGFLVDSQIILGTFFTDSYLYLFVIKLSFLVFTFQISFFLNALFYTDEYISDAYHNNGVLDFFSGLPKSCNIDKTKRHCKGSSNSSALKSKVSR